MSDAPEVLREQFAPPPPAPPIEREPIKLWEMLFVANDEAERIENVEAARAKVGEQPLPDRVHRAQVLRALARFLTVIEPHMPDIKALVERKRRRK